MKQGYTHVSFVLDNSGSMSHLRGDTIGGYNSFLAKQKEDPGKMTFSLYQFNPEERYRGHYSSQIVAQPGAQVVPVSPGVPVLARPETVSATYEFVDLKTVPELAFDTYQCNCITPLLDAIGHAIDQTGKLLAALSEEERPEKVIFVILTDGEENASRAYNHYQITAKIKEQTDGYNWDFLFLGANQDAIQAGGSFGITRGRSMSLSATSASMCSSYNAISDTVSMMKSAINTKDVNFDETIRSEVMDGTYAGKKVTK